MVISDTLNLELPEQLSLESLVAQHKICLNDLLSREIDWNFFQGRNLKRPSSILRFRNYLENQGVYTYGELIDFTQDQILENGYLGSVRGVRDPYVTRLIGPTTLKTFYSHLNNLQIKLFSTDYTASELV